jgi:dolichol-phosphate mannosyltransferase
MGKNLIIIPTYNEIENIEKMVRTVFDLPREFELLIVMMDRLMALLTKVKELQKNILANYILKNVKAN